jgi:hypothetical protein
MSMFRGLMSCDRALDSLITNTFSLSRIFRAGNVSGILIGILSIVFLGFAKVVIYNAFVCDVERNSVFIILDIFML